MIFARRSALTHRLQLTGMGLTELPSELFRMKNVKVLWLGVNNLCSLPSDIAHLGKLERLYVGLPKRLGRDLTKSHVVSGQQRQPAQVSSTRVRSADKSEVAYCAAFEADGRNLTLRHRAFRSARTSSRCSQQKSASSHSSSGSTCEIRVECIVI